jgi:glucose/arabinose dehydrogenase
VQKILILFLFIVFSQASCTQTAGDKPQLIEDIFLPEGDGVKVKPWIENLEIPWSLVFLPDGRAITPNKS